MTNQQGKCRKIVNNILTLQRSDQVSRSGANDDSIIGRKITVTRLDNKKSQTV